MTASADPCHVEALRAVVPSHALRAPRVSDWSVGMHVEHCSLATTGIARALAESTPPRPASKGLGLWRRAILLSGRIPRGRARAPRSVVSVVEPEPEALLAGLDEAARCLARAAASGPEAWFEHFALGVMDRDQSLRFIAVHNRHHLRIVRDVLRACGAG